MKNRFFIIIFVQVVASIALVSGAFGGMTIFEMFNHEKHTALFGDQFACTKCHAGSKDYNKKRVFLNCHACHNNPKAAMAGPGDCSLCHNSSITPFEPRSHKGNWKRSHGQIAAQDGQKCNRCHTAFFCADCHQQRDTIRQTMHPRNY
jgi:hypothetical protein